MRRNYSPLADVQIKTPRGVSVPSRIPAITDMRLLDLRFKHINMVKTPGPRLNVSGLQLLR